MQKELVLFLLLFIVLSCDTSRKTAAEEEALPPVEVPPSYLNIRVNFPVAELEEGVNQILPGKLLDGGFPMKDDDDTLFLTIVRRGNLDLTVRNEEVFASIPLDVTVSAKKKVMGITFSNKDTPITFSGTVSASTVLSLQNDWNLEFTCAWGGFELEGEPTVSFLGMKFNVESAINRVVGDYSDHLADLICRSLREAVSFDQILGDVWEDLQSSHRVAKNPKPLYIRSSPVALNGTLVPKHTDTLAIHLEYRTRIHVSPENRVIINSVPLSQRADPLNTKPTFLAYPELFVPYPFLEEVLGNELLGKNFQYEKYKATITGLTLARKGQTLEVQLQTKGDLAGKVSITGKPSLNESLELYLDDFEYEIDAENGWVKMTDFALHQFAEGYLAEQIKIDLAPYFRNLDDIIMQKTEQSALGDKIGLRVSFDRISSYNVVLTETGIQWILVVEGKSAINLKNAILKGSNG